MSGDQSATAQATTRPKGWLTRTVVAFGMASLFSDAGHEMATAILPLFLASIGGSSAALGLIEGLADALSTGAKLWSGWFSDGLKRRKPIAVLGYVATGFGMAGFALTTRPVEVFLVRVTSWVGRGARGPVRDAMLSEAVPVEAVSRAFGFHRAMDTAGAVIGPLIALSLMASFGWPTLFALTLIPGILSVIAFSAIRESAVHRRRLSLTASLADLPPDFRRFMVAVGIFGMGDFSRSLLILRASQLSAARGDASPDSIAVGLYVFHNVVHAISAYGIGVLGARFGTRRVLAMGYAAFAAMAVGFALLPVDAPIGPIIVLFALAGLAMSAEEVLEGTAAAEMLPEKLRGTGYGALAAVNGVGDFMASVVVGSLWTWVSPSAGFAYAAVAGAAGAVALGRLR